MFWEESSEEEEESSDEEEEEVEEGIRSTVSGTGTESGLDTGLNTATSMGSRSADEINLRKKGTDTAESQKSLFQRVPERNVTFFNDLLPLPPPKDGRFGSKFFDPRVHPVREDSIISPQENVIFCIVFLFLVSLIF